MKIKILLLSPCMSSSRFSKLSSIRALPADDDPDDFTLGFFLIDDGGGTKSSSDSAEGGEGGEGGGGLFFCFLGVGVGV